MVFDDDDLPLELLSRIGVFRVFCRVDDPRSHPLYGLYFTRILRDLYLGVLQDFMVRLGPHGAFLRGGKELELPSIGVRIRDASRQA